MLFLTETLLSTYANDINPFSIGKDINKPKDTLAVTNIIIYNSN